MKLIEVGYSNLFISGNETVELDNVTEIRIVNKGNTIMKFMGEDFPANEEWYVSLSGNKYISKFKEKITFRNDPEMVYDGDNPAINKASIYYAVIKNIPKQQTNCTN